MCNRQMRSINLLRAKSFIKCYFLEKSVFFDLEHAFKEDVEILQEYAQDNIKYFKHVSTDNL
jgi:hypothetical protein